MSRRTLALALTAGSLASGLGLFLSWPLSTPPVPAALHCHALSDGAYVALEAPAQVFGVGLSYAGHIEETAASFDAGASAPVFRKRAEATRPGAAVALPSPAALLARAEVLEPGLAAAVEADHPELDPLLDYEVELGIVLLEDVDPEDLRDPGFAPRLGFFVANDLSARALALLGEGRDDRETFWGVSKSFPGFLPLPTRAFVPREAHPSGVPCVVLETRVNGELRQRQSTRDLIYTPKAMLGFVRVAFPEARLSAGTVVLTGTPGGVAISTPRWKVRLAQLLELDRFTKLRLKLRERDAFLRPGDVVTVSGEGLGAVEVTVTASGPRGAAGTRASEGA
ncbi:MAG: fumarylacetoacetate hydrolase family protein [Myxococcota bacterium]